MKVRSPDRDNFKKYGKVVEYPHKDAKGRARNLWRIVHTAPGKTGWRVACLILRDKAIGRMECHPDSDETFEPVKGRAHLFLAGEQDLSAIECFALDKPVILYQGVWHGLVSVTPEAEIRIMENNVVTCRYWPLEFRVRNLEDLRRNSGGGGIA
jgi:ureidoglycolate hydrolase